MSVSFEAKETNRGVLTFTISQEVIKPELDRVFNKVKKDINLPGFRKGHLPRAVFNQKFGEEALYKMLLMRFCQLLMRQRLLKQDLRWLHNQKLMLCQWRKVKTGQLLQKLLQNLK